MTQIII